MKQHIFRDGMKVRLKENGKIGRIKRANIMPEIWHFTYENEKGWCYCDSSLIEPYEEPAPDHREKISEAMVAGLEEQVKKLTANTLLAVRCPLVEIDREVLQMCVEMYQKGEKLTAIKWLIEEAKRTEYTFGIKWAHEYFQSIGLEAVEGNDR